MHTKKNVMVVDDEDIVHFISQRMLSSFKFINKIYSAYDGRQAVQLLRDSCKGIIQIPEVILMDLHMPIMNGLELLKEIKTMECLRGERIITIMFSSTTDPNEIRYAAELGIDHFFSKPLQIEKLKMAFADFGE